MEQPRRDTNEAERDDMRRWLHSWTATSQLLEAERDRRLAALTDDEAWRQSQELLAAWEPQMDGDAGHGLELQQRVFRRWSARRRKS